MLTLASLYPYNHRYPPLLSIETLCIHAELDISGHIEIL